MQIKLDEQYLCDVPRVFSWIEDDGMDRGVMSYVDHPAFAEVRDFLEYREYISVQKHWHNGDRVLKPFTLNDQEFNIGDKFLCATAMANKFKWDRK